MRNKETIFGDVTHISYTRNMLVTCKHNSVIKVNSLKLEHRSMNIYYVYINIDIINITTGYTCMTICISICMIHIYL